VEGDDKPFGLEVTAGFLSLSPARTVSRQVALAVRAEGDGLGQLWGAKRTRVTGPLDSRWWPWADLCGLRCLECLFIFPLWGV